MCLILKPRPHFVGEISTPQTLVILDLCLRKTRAGKSHDHRDVIVFQELLLLKRFPSSLKRKRGMISNSSGLKSAFEIKLHSRDGLVWTVDLTVEIHLRFQISPELCRRRSISVPFDTTMIQFNFNEFNTKIATPWP